MASAERINEPRRLAFVITELEFGGAERCLTNLVCGLDRRLFAPVVYSLWQRPAPGQAELVRNLESAGIPIQFLGLRRPWQLYAGTRRLQRLLARQQPDLMQTFLFHANVVGALAGAHHKIPHIVLGIRVADRSAWRIVTERTAARFADRVVCVSQSVATFAQREMRIPEQKLLVIPNGIEVRPRSETPPANLAELGVRPGHRAIAVIGRLHSQKGLDWLLQVAPRILAAVPDVDLLIVGRGPEESPLRRQAESLSIHERVHFAGWRPDVPAILRSASLLLLPSRWEGMPNVVLEAMAAGLPVVATNVEGVNELLGSLAEQQLVHFGDDAALVTKTASILQNFQQAHELGCGNQARVMAEFSLNRMVSQYQDLYCDLLDLC